MRGKLYHLMMNNNLDIVISKWIICTPQNHTPKGPNIGFLRLVTGVQFLGFLEHLHGLVFLFFGPVCVVLLHLARCHNLSAGDAVCAVLAGRLECYIVAETRGVDHHQVTAYGDLLDPADAIRALGVAMELFSRHELIPFPFITLADPSQRKVISRSTPSNPSVCRTTELT